MINRNAPARPTVTRTATARTSTAQPFDRSDWRMDPPSPSGVHDLLQATWPGALVGLMLLSLLLAFASVVRDSVRRGDQLRSEASAAWHCDALGPQAGAMSCTRLDPSARLRNAESAAAQSSSLPPLAALQP